jgi:hypothetical protein
MDYGIAETGIARGSPPGTTTEVLRAGFPFAEFRVVSDRHSCAHAVAHQVLDGSPVAVHDGDARSGVGSSQTVSKRPLERCSCALAG